MIDWKEVRTMVTIDDAITFIGDKVRKQREEINYMLTHGEHPDKISEHMRSTEYFESTVRFLQELKKFEVELGKCISGQEEKPNV